MLVIVALSVCACLNCSLAQNPDFVVRLPQPAATAAELQLSERGGLRANIIISWKARLLFVPVSTLVPIIIAGAVGFRLQPSVSANPYTN